MCFGVIMEFILNNKKYSINNHELYINYLMVDSYFRQNYSKYDYDIEFDFIDCPTGSVEIVEDGVNGLLINSRSEEHTSELQSQ